MTDKSANLFGVLSIVFGVLLALQSFIAFNSEYQPPDLPDVSTLPKVQNDAVQKMVTQSFAELAKLRVELRPINLARDAVKGIFAILLIALGLLLYRRVPAAKKFGIVWCALALVYAAADTFVSATITSPKMIAVQEHVVQAATLPGAGLMKSTLEAGRWLIVVAGFFFEAIYPAILLYALTRRPKPVQ